MTSQTENRLTSDSRSGLTLQREAGTWWTQIQTTVIGLLLGGSLALVLYTIVLRLLAPAYAPDFTEELTVYAVMWSVLVACGQVTSNREHVCADLFVHMMPAWLQRWAAIAGNLAGAAFSLGLTAYGSQVAYEAWDFGDLSATSLRFPLWIYYACLPFASGLIAIAHVSVALEMIRGLVPVGHQPGPVSEEKR